MKHLYGLIILIGHDNNMVPVAPEDLPAAVDGFDIKALNEQASQLNISEAETFTTGEESEISELTEKKGLHDLNRFLNEAFDGYLTDLFFQPV